MKPGQRVRVKRFDENRFNLRVKMNGRTGTVVAPSRDFSTFIHVVLDEPWTSEGSNPITYGTKDRPMKFIAFELEVIE